jgi:hypothetical protein
VLARGGEGAGPDRFFSLLSEVLCAECKGLIVTSNFSRALSVKLCCHR